MNESCMIIVNINHKLLFKMHRVEQCVAKHAMHFLFTSNQDYKPIDTNCGSANIAYPFPNIPVLSRVFKFLQFFYVLLVPTIDFIIFSSNY